MATRKRSEIIFPDREATIRDVARFSLWCGIPFTLALTPRRPEKKTRTKVDRKKPRA